MSQAVAVVQVKVNGSLLGLGVQWREPGKGDI